MRYKKTDSPFDKVQKFHKKTNEYVISKSVTDEQIDALIEEMGKFLDEEYYETTGSDLRWSRNW